MNKKVNWGIIGLGNTAMNFAKASQLTDNAILKGISSKNKKKISNFKESFGVKSEYCFDNYEAIFFENGLRNNFGKMIEYDCLFEKQN